MIRRFWFGFVGVAFLRWILAWFGFLSWIQFVSWIPAQLEYPPITYPVASFFSSIPGKGGLFFLILVLHPFPSMALKGPGIAWQAASSSLHFLDCGRVACVYLSTYVWLA
jgi:vacuolar-type H+-ATPase subunit I/STV1